MQKTVLVFTPHPDDETLGMWWTIAKMVAKWYKVCVCLACEQKDEKMKKIRWDEFCMAMSTLWVKWDDRYFLEYEDWSLYKVDYSQLVGDIDKLIIQLKPDMVFIPEKSSHQDHKTIYDACITSLRISLSRWFNVPEVYTYDYPPLAWNVEEKTFNIVQDITEFIDKKVQAFNQYASQNSWDTRANEEGVKNYAASCWFWWWYKYAERFRMLRKLNDF